MSVGQWLFAEAAETGDWESAALALRADLRKANADRDKIIASMEAAWTRVAAAELAGTFELDGALLEFAAETELHR